MVLQMQTLNDFDFLTVVFIMGKNWQWMARRTYMPDDLARSNRFILSRWRNAQTKLVSQIWSVSGMLCILRYSCSIPVTR